jgi:transposase
MQADTAAQMAISANSEKIPVASFERRRPVRCPLPEHLPRERVIYPPPAACPCCGGTTLRKISEDVTETLEVTPRQWKVIQHVREKLSCRACEAISQPPAPSHPIARGRAGPKLLADILFSKYGLHLPLNRQSAVCVREGIDLDVSDTRRLGGRRGGHPDATGRGHPYSRLRSRAHPCRRHHHAGADQRQDSDRPIMDVCARRSAVCRSKTASGGVLLFARSWRRAPRAAFGHLCRADAGGYLCGLQAPL